MSKDLRKQLIKLAHANPSMRKDLLPLLKVAGAIPTELRKAVIVAMGHPEGWGVEDNLTEEWTERFTHKFADPKMKPNKIKVKIDSADDFLISSMGPMETASGVGLEVEGSWDCKVTIISKTFKLKGDMVLDFSAILDPDVYPEVMEVARSTQYLDD